MLAFKGLEVAAPGERDRVAVYKRRCLMMDRASQAVRPYADVVELRALKDEIINPFPVKCRVEIWDADKFAPEDLLNSDRIEAWRNIDHHVKS